ncbi:Eukaryotic translation initiation factor-related, putative isoform 1 [Hibiscus syriacus]|uniref:Eukaryotic translation initiation factor-related, putative isoform 1 n=1 Tax=Hibiscus syriacus TaxID=106335 RepID=A0A6A2XC90_HIBSY|nr:Eukaryotic translation initiation factor-related, putative isoform 1 [Hibiscus syriacus]
MQACCDLEVDVDGGEVFIVDKKTLASFSKRFVKLLGNLMDNKRDLKVVFDDCPGGAEGFELVARFCYNNRRTEITPANIVLLNCAAQFMEMDSDGPRPSLLNQTKRSLDGISFWSWSELLVALKECQDLLSPSKPSLILDKVLDCVIGRLVSPVVASPYTSSSENSSFRCSSNTRSNCSIRSNPSHVSWWFKDLLFLNIDLIDKIEISYCHPKREVQNHGVNAFHNELSPRLSSVRLRKVASLLDSYLVEVSADSYLNPSKFAALVLLLPDSARESHDRLFQAIDIYLQIHGGICEAQKMRICSALNYAKLSTDALRDLARNSKFPSRIAIHAPLVVPSLPRKVSKRENSDQILAYAKRFGVPEKAEQLDVHLQGMQCRPRQAAKYAAKCTRGYGARSRNADLGAPGSMRRVDFSINAKVGDGLDQHP